MSPLIAYHSSPRRHRAAIERYGLLPNLPNASQKFGVYVFRDDYTHPTRHVKKGNEFRRVRTHWAHGPENDLWQVSYIGPLCPDQFVDNGLVLFYPPQSVSRVSRLS